MDFEPCCNITERKPFGIFCRSCCGLWIITTTGASPHYVHGKDYVWVDAHLLATPVIADLDLDNSEEVVIPVSYYFDKDYYQDPKHADLPRRRLLWSFFFPRVDWPTSSSPISQVRSGGESTPQQQASEVSLAHCPNGFCASF